MVNLTCPYCGSELDCLPEARRKCPQCREWIYPRKNPHTLQKEVVTKAVADEWSAIWSAHYQSQMEEQDEARRLFMLPDNVRLRIHDRLTGFLKAGATMFIVRCLDPGRNSYCEKHHDKHYDICQEIAKPQFPCPDCTKPDCYQEIDLDSIPPSKPGGIKIKLELQSDFKLDNFIKVGLHDPERNRKG